MTPGEASPAAPEGSPDPVREAIASGDPARAMPALAGLREMPER